jgi:hypothetical protein
MAESGTKNSHWQKLGVGALLAVLLVGVLLWFTGRLPQSEISAKSAAPWNSHAVQTTYAGVRVREIDASNAAVVFLYDLDNRSQSDYQLVKGPDVVVMSRLKSASTLSSEKPVTLSASAFVPANNRTRIALEIAEPFSWPARMDASSDARFRELIAQETAEVDGFVIFDQAHRYQIDLAGSWPAIEKTRVRR